MPLVARALAPIRERPALPWELSVRLGEEPQAAHEFEVGVGSRAAGHSIRDLPLGEHAWVRLVIRDGAATRPGGSLELRAGDRVLLLARPARRRRQKHRARVPACSQRQPVPDRASERE